MNVQRRQFQRGAGRSDAELSHAVVPHPGHFGTRGRAAPGRHQRQGVRSTGIEVQ